MSYTITPEPNSANMVNASVGKSIKGMQIHDTPFADDKTYQKSMLFKQANNSDLSVYDRSVMLKGDDVEADIFNELFGGTAADIEILDTALTNLKQNITVSASEFKSKTDDISLGIKKLSGSLDVFALYSSLVNEDIQGVTETFSTLDSVISGGSLSIDTPEGIVTLPQIQVQPLDISKAAISVTGDGAFADGHGIDKLYDGDIVSYMKFMQTGSEKLNLQLDIKLASADIINNITLLENNFGQHNWINLEELSISTDGNRFRTIAKNKLLKAETGNYSPEFSFTFIPRKVSYVRIKLSQVNKDIFDNTLNIGICDLSLNKITYSDSGSIEIRKDIQATNINSVSLHLTKAIYDNIALKTRFQISFDNSQWFDIAPVADNSNNEILSINQPWVSNTINAGSGFTSIWFKIFYDRIMDKDAILKLAGQNNLYNTEFLQIPATAPYQATLSQAADINTVSVGIVSDLSCGRQSSNFILLGNTKKGIYKYNYPAPFDTKGLESVLIGDVKLDRAASLGDLYDRLEKGYFLDTEKKSIFIYIDETTPIARKTKLAHPWLVVKDQTYPPEVAPDDYSALTEDKQVRLFFKDDVIYSPKTNIIPLTLNSDAIKEHISVSRLKAINGVVVIEPVTDLIKAGKTVIRLTSIPVRELDIKVTGGFETQFIDGKTEFSTESEFAYSIDFSQGILYLRNAYPVDVTISYSRELETVLNPIDYDVSYDGKTVTISRNAYDPSSYYKFRYNIMFPVEGSDYNVLTGGRAIQLNTSAIISDFMGFNSLTNKLLKVDYNYNDTQDSFASNILQYLTPIIPELSIIYSSDIL